MPALNAFKQFNQGTQPGSREIKNMIINGKSYQDMQDKYSHGVVDVEKIKTSRQTIYLVWLMEDRMYCPI